MIEGLRYLTDDLLALRRMTPKEYNMRMKAAMLRKVDAYQLATFMAFYNRQATNVDKSGKKYIVKSPKELYDADEIEKRILGNSKKDAVYGELLKRAKRVAEYRRIKKHDK